MPPESALESSWSLADGRLVSPCSGFALGGWVHGQVFFVTEHSCGCCGQTLLGKLLLSGAGGEVAVKRFLAPSWTEEVGSCSEGLLVAGAASVPRMVPAHF